MASESSCVFASGCFRGIPLEGGIPVRVDTVLDDEILLEGEIMLLEEGIPVEGVNDCVGSPGFFFTGVFFFCNASC